MKYFVLSDVHNHFSEMMSALNDKGFDINNSDHKLILVGDAFDRGHEALQVLEFLRKMIELKKIVWIVGNHELFLIKRFQERCFKSHGETYQTMFQIASAYSGRMNLSDEEVLSYCEAAGFRDLIENNVIPYFETDCFIFVHGFIPLKKGKYDPDWRDVPLKSWCGPAMKNGMKSVMVNGIRIPGKTFVCGHSPAAYGNVRAGINPAEWDDPAFVKLRANLKHSENYYPYYGDGVIGIDANCYKTGFVNCIVIEEGGNR